MHTCLSLSWSRSQMYLFFSRFESIWFYLNEPTMTSTLKHNMKCYTRIKWKWVKLRAICDCTFVVVVSCWHFFCLLCAPYTSQFPFQFHAWLYGKRVCVCVSYDLSVSILLHDDVAYGSPRIDDDDDDELIKCACDEKHPNVSFWELNTM